MIFPSFSFRDRRIFAALWRNSPRLAGENSRHFSNAFRAFSTDFSTSVRVEARNLLSTLPLAGFTVSIHRLALFAAKRIILGAKIRHRTPISYTGKLQLSDNLISIDCLPETPSRKNFPAMRPIREAEMDNRPMVDRAGFEPAALRSRVSAFPQTGSGSRTCQAGDLRPDTVSIPG